MWVGVRVAETVETEAGVKMVETVAVTVVTVVTVVAVLGLVKVNTAVVVERAPD